MSTRFSGRTLWLAWTLVSTIGFMLGGAAGSTLFPGRDDALSFALSFAISGLVTGTGQWFVLRVRYRGLATWIPATGAGFAIFGAAFALVRMVARDRVDDPLGFAICFVLTGAAVGIAQWLVLRREVGNAGAWIPASTLGFAGFGAVTAHVYEIVSAAIGGVFGILIGGAIVLGIVMVYGGLTGVVLVRAERG